MQAIPEEQVIERLRQENPWWQAPHTVGAHVRGLAPRAYLPSFLSLLRVAAMRRAVIVLGPRRVGKTVLVHHAIDALLRDELSPQDILYCSVDSPVYSRRRLDELVKLGEKASGTSHFRVVLFDEIQYVRDWEIHLKVLVDDSPRVKYVASGSAAAALRLKSRESGAGRFTDFHLPPLTFAEYLTLRGEDGLVESTETTRWGVAPDLDALNAAFVRYLNFGGYPEVALVKEVQDNPAQFVKSDIIDKVLLRDLPSLYGIHDVQELNYLFTTLAFNTGQEIQLEELATHSRVAKNTIKRYLDYLEAAFLIRRVYRIDRSARRFKRETHFKVYVTNSSLRAALFAPLGANDAEMGHVVETGCFSQWLPSMYPMHYARWTGKGPNEVDFVLLNERLRPAFAAEVKWTDAPAQRPERDLRALLDFAKANGLGTAAVTTRTIEREQRIGDFVLHFVPAALYCHAVSRNLVKAGWNVSRIFREPLPGLPAATPFE
ncbi:MAG: ATPase [Gemmatimonas sp.]|nr:ATPase [Gemmatimonas sp.]